MADDDLGYGWNQGLRDAFQGLGWGSMFAASAQNPALQPGLAQSFIQLNNQPSVWREQRNQHLGLMIMQGVQQGVIPWDQAGPALGKLGFDTRGMDVQYPQNQELLLRQITAMPGSRDAQGGWTDVGRQRIAQAIPDYADKILKQEALMESERALAARRAELLKQQINQENIDKKAADLEAATLGDPRRRYGNISGAAPPPEPGPPPVGAEPVPGKPAPEGVPATPESPDIQLRPAAPEDQQAAWTDYATGVQTRGLAPPPPEGTPIKPDEALPGEDPESLKEMNDVAQADEQKITATGPPETPWDLRKMGQLHEELAAKQAAIGATKQAAANYKEAARHRSAAHALERDLLEQEKQLRLNALANLKLNAAKMVEDDKDGIHQLATDWLFNGKTPPGRLGSGIYERANAERARMGKAMGLTPEEISRLPYDNAAKQKAITRLTDWAGSVERLNGELVKDLDVAIGYAKQFSPSDLRMLNKAILSGQLEFNDPIANGYAAAVQTVQNKYGRVIAGPTSNAMIPVEAMKHAHDVVSTGASVAAWQELKRVMILDANNTLTSTKETAAKLRDSILSGGKKEAFEPNPVPASQVEYPPTKQGGQTVAPIQPYEDKGKEQRYQEWKKRNGY